MKESLKKFLSFFGIRNQYDAERYAHFSRIKNKINAKQEDESSQGLALIVFSKDRGLQLEALLRTYFELAENPVPLFVLYTASSEKFKKTYREVEEMYQEQNVNFIFETNFKNDLVALFNRLSASKVMFLVDDLFFKNPIDFNILEEVNPKENILSLRMGNHLNFSYTHQEIQNLPALEPHVSLSQFLTWKWNKATHDWAYPLSVDGHLFDFEELKIIVNELDYKAPNSFEAALLLMNPLFLKRPGLCFHHSVIINNPCNKIQVENENVSGEINVEGLNKKWEKGYRLNYETYYGVMNSSAHQELELKFTKR